MIRWPRGGYHGAPSLNRTMTTPTISFTLPADDSRVPEIFAIINGVAQSRITVTEAAPAVEEPKPKATKKKAAKKEPAKKKAAPKKAEPAPEPEQPKLTPDYLKDLARETADAVGIEAVRELFGKFKVARLSDLPEAKYAKFATALNEARSAVA